MTHSEVINIVHRFVLKRFSCGIAFKELKTISSECADVIGFGSYMHSVLVEVKVSRSDFHADKKKPFRVNPELGVGRFRFYACPEGLIQPNDLPNNWGLIWIVDGKCQVIVNPYCKSLTGNIFTDGFDKWNTQAERDILYSALRRRELIKQNN